MSKKSLLKVCALFAALFVAAAVPMAAADTPACGAAQDQGEAAVRQRYAENTVQGFVKGFELSGRKVTPEQRSQMQRVVWDSFPEFIALVKKAGLYDEYRKQLFDPEIRELDNQILKGTTIQEVTPLLQKEMQLISKRYPELVKWTATNPDMQAFSARMMRKLAAILQ